MTTIPNTLFRTRRNSILHPILFLKGEEVGVEIDYSAVPVVPGWKLQARSSSHWAKAEEHIVAVATANMSRDENIEMR